MGFFRAFDFIAVGKTHHRENPQRALIAIVMFLGPTSTVHVAASAFTNGMADRASGTRRTRPESMD